MEYKENLYPAFNHFPLENIIAKLDLPIPIRTNP
jgi:hypothetical protein